MLNVHSNPCIIRQCIGVIIGWLILSGIVTAQQNALNAEEQSFIAQHPVIKVASDNYPPFSFDKNGQHIGYSVDYLNLLGDKVGLQFEFVVAESWSEVLNLFKQKQVDMLHTFLDTPERRAFTLYSKPFFYNDGVIYTHENQFDIDRLADLNGKKVAITKDHAYIEYLQQYYPEIQILEQKDILTTLQTVAYGKADAAIDGFVVAEYTIDKHLLTNLKVAANLNLPTHTKHNVYYFGIRHDYPLLRNIINKAMDRLTYQEVAALKQKWLFNQLHNRLKKIDFTPEQYQYLASKKFLKMCVHPQWKPIEYLNDKGQHQGIIADFYQLIRQYSDINLKLVKTSSWAESLAFIQNRRCDLLSAAMQTHNRLKYLNFTTPFYRFPLVIATRKSGFFVEDINLIADKPLALPTGNVFSEILPRHYPNIQLIKVDNAQTGLQMVNTEQIYGYLGNPVVINYIINKLQLDLKISGRLPENWQLSVATRSDEPQLNAIFEHIINNINPEEKQRIYTKWMAIQYEKTFDYTFFWQIILITTLILLIIVYWNRRLAREIYLRQQAQQEIQYQKQELEVKNTALLQLDREKNEFLGIVAHDLKNPLGSIEGFAELMNECLQESEGVDKTCLKKYVHLTQETSKQMFELINNLLDINAIESGEINIICQTINILPLVEKLINNYKSRTEAKNIYIYLQYEQQEYWAYADKNIAQQILDNIISNAIKYSPMGSHIDIRLYQQAGRACCAVHDQGHGLSTEDQANLFKKFKRLSTQPTGNENSTGLGLFIVKKLLDAMHGEVYCESQLDVGSCFTVVFADPTSQGHSDEQ